MPVATMKVPAGLPSSEQKQELVTKVTQMYVETFGERARGTAMVLVDEVPDGGSSIGGHVLTADMLNQPGTG